MKIYGADKGMFENGKYEAVAKQLLEASAQYEVSSPQLTAALTGKVKFDSETLKDGKVAAGIGGVIPPMIFLVVFYISMTLLSNQMLNSTLEEKENRVTEMILTTLNPTTLITGKIISLFAAELVQILVFVAPVGLAYLFFRDSLPLLASGERIAQPSDPGCQKFQVVPGKHLPVVRRLIEVRKQPEKDLLVYQRQGWITRAAHESCPRFWCVGQWVCKCGAYPGRAEGMMPCVKGCPPFARPITQTSWARPRPSEGRWRQGDSLTGRCPEKPLKGPPGPRAHGGLQGVGVVLPRT
ncbi:ABC transporter permease [Pseudarthrobacter sp902506025]|uniref:ABC-2 type transporter transmembrane domain-containing protein n=2 Tax=Micrococcaceae TaxID=1268 RepID=A0ABT9UHF5_9MICC|nr:hypothetical protein [Pseudarthrobacter defluvii]